MFSNCVWVIVSRWVSVPSPSCPEEFIPQAQKGQPGRSAREWKSPAESASASSNPSTRTGLVRWVVVPSPSWPELFCPQPQAAPVESMASEKLPPVAMAVTAPASPTATGVLCAVAVVPLPSCPLEFCPHATALLSESSTTEWLAPAAMAVAPRARLTG